MNSKMRFFIIILVLRSVQARKGSLFADFGLSFGHDGHEDEIQVHSKLSSRLFETDTARNLKAAARYGGPKKLARRFWNALTSTSLGPIDDNVAGAPTSADTGGRSTDDTERAAGAPITAGRRRLQTGSTATAGAYTIINTSLVCSGIGIPLGSGPGALSASPSPAPAAGIPIIQNECNGVNITAPLYAGVTAVQQGGATGGNVGALAAALAASGAAGAAASNATGANATGAGVGLASIVNASTLLPLGWPTTLSVLQRAGLQPTLGTDLSNITTAGALFPASRGPAQEATILPFLPAPVLEAALSSSDVRCNATQVGALNVTAPTGATGNATPAVPAPAAGCACPVDYAGASCQIPRHFSCVATIADPLYHACMATNGAGFAPATALETAWGVAVPVSGEPDTLAREFESFAGAIYEDAADAAAQMPRPPDTRVYGGYRTGIPGDPPCMFIDINRIRAATGAGSGGLPSGGIIEVPFRVSCAFADAPGTARLTSGAVLVDPHGTPYADGPDLEGLIGVLRASGADRVNVTINGQRVEGEAVGLADLDTASALQESGKRAAVVVAAVGPPAWACNGTRLTDAAIQRRLAARGYGYTFLNGSSTFGAVPPDPWPHLSTQRCLEAAFSYELGHPGTSSAALAHAQASALFGGSGSVSADDAQDLGALQTLLLQDRSAQPFSLSQAPLVPLALRVRPVSTVHLSDSRGLSMVSLPTAALDGSVDVTVPVDIGALLSQGEASPPHLMGGRLLLEATVVMAPEGLAAGPWAASQRAPGENPDSAVGPTPVLPLSDVASLLDAVTSTVTLASVSGAAPSLGVALPGPLLVTSGVCRIMLDDVSYEEPRGKDWTAVGFGVGIGLGVPVLIALVLAAWWLRARARAREHARTQAMVKAMKEGEDAVSAAAATASATSSAGSGAGMPSAQALSSGVDGHPDQHVRRRRPSVSHAGS